MSIASEITRINENIANAYTEVSNKGGTLPATRNSANLPTAITSIPSGTDTSDATLDSGARMLSGYTAYSKGVKYTGSIVNRGSKTFTPSTSQQTGSAGYYSDITVEAVTSSIDSNIRPENIKEDVQILGVTGTLKSGGSDIFYNLKSSNGTVGNALFYNMPANMSQTDFNNFLSTLDTSLMTTMSEMFYSSLSNSSLRTLTSLNLSNFDTRNVKTMSYMFYYCMALTSLNLSNFDTSNVTNMSYMFAYCRALTSLNLSNFDTSNVTTMSNMFYSCTKLKTITGVLDMDKEPSISNMFGSSTSNSPGLLETVNIKNLYKTGLNLQYCTALSHDSLMYLINNLFSTSTAKTVTLGTTNKNKLTAEEIAIATNKGWTLA